MGKEGLSPQTGVRLNKESFYLQTLTGVVRRAEGLIARERVLCTGREKVAVQTQFLRSYKLIQTTEGSRFIPQEDSHQIGDIPEQVFSLIQQGRGVIYFGEVTDPIINLGGEAITKEGKFFSLHVFVPGLKNSQWAEENVYLLKNYNPLLKEQLQEVLLRKNQLTTDSENFFDTKSEGSDIISFNARVDVMDSPSHILVNSFVESVGWQMIIPRHKNEFPEFVRQMYALDESRRKTHDNNAKFFVIEQFVIGEKAYTYDSILMAGVPLNSSARTPERLTILEEKNRIINEWIREGKTGANVSSLGLSARTSEKHLTPHQTVEFTTVEPDGIVRQITLILPMTPEIAQYLNTNTQMSLEDAHSLIKQLSPDAYNEIFNIQPAEPAVPQAPSFIMEPVIPLCPNAVSLLASNPSGGGFSTKTSERIRAQMRPGETYSSLLVIPVALAPIIFAGNIALPFIATVDFIHFPQTETLSTASNTPIAKETVPDAFAQAFFDVALNPDLPPAEDDHPSFPDGFDLPPNFPDTPNLDGDGSGGGRKVPEFKTDWEKMEERYHETVVRRPLYSADRVVTAETALFTEGVRVDKPTVNSDDRYEFQSQTEFVVYASTTEVLTPKQEQETELLLYSPNSNVNLERGNKQSDFSLNSSNSRYSANLTNNQTSRPGLLDEDNEFLDKSSLTVSKKIPQKENFSRKNKIAGEESSEPNEQKLLDEQPNKIEQMRQSLPEEIARLFLVLRQIQGVNFPTKSSNPPGKVEMPNWLAQIFLKTKLGGEKEISGLNQRQVSSITTPINTQDEVYKSRAKENGQQSQKQNNFSQILKAKTNVAFLSLLLLAKLRLLQGNLHSFNNLKKLLLTDTLLLFLVNPKLFLVRNDNLKLNT